ncbi:MAG TPA: alpha/beta hydrolase [Terriglobales bacterium]|nr:alpha/beta hydrolase [Terriglobales bacterium]
MNRFQTDCITLAAIAILPCLAWAVTPPPAPGKLIDLGGHRLHVHCTGKGTPTVVVESGLGDYSFDWILVQNKVATFTRICAYDRAGYAWSDTGPKPRTFSQINLELHDALAKLGERAPFLMVGHSYGGPVARNFALTYPKEVVGMVLVDAAHEGLRVPVGPKKTLRLGEDAKGAPIPVPHESMDAADKIAIRAEDLPAELKNLDPMFKVLPEAEQLMQVWAQQQPGVYDAQQSETQWSGEYFRKWLVSPQAGMLGNIPVIVLSRAEGGYGDAELDIPASQFEQERTEGQRKLTQLSSNSRQVIVRSGHNMNLEAPGAVASAIRQVVMAVRNHSKL